MTRERLSNAKRIVVKIGSSLLDEGGRRILRPLVEQLKSLHDEGREIVLVTSGAIHFGTESLNRDTPPVTLPQKQATAAVGQPILMSFYKELFDEQDLKTAQVLLTQDGIHNHDTYLNACNTMNELLDEGIVPIVNENDTVATEEIQFGNNDTLASLVTTMVDGDVLVILSDVAGLYPDEPSPDRDPIPRVDTIDEDIEAMARPSDKNSTTVGGMVTKIEAARTLTRAGTAMVIADGRREHILRDLLSGKELGTLFSPDQDTEALQGRKRWIGYHLPVKGTINVDSGAAEALKNRGTSLLPSGVTEVSGQFERGDAVSVRDESGEEFGRGLVNYNREQVHRLRGCQTDEISDILGHHDFDEIIHRDNLVIFNND